MNPQEFFSRGAHWLVAGVLGVAAVVTFGYLRRRHGQGHQHVQRLAAEIIEVARSIQVDLQALPRTTDVAELARRCNECRRRTEQAAAARLITIDLLEEATGQLHDDHRRVVDLRSELDLLLAALRSGQPVARACKFATGSKPSRSRWATTSLLTRPSSLG